MLIVMSGLPGVGKTAVSRELARTIGAAHLRIDSIEEALRAGGMNVAGEGYEVAYAVAADNLALGRTVVADCVNPWPLTRAAWRLVAERAGVRRPWDTPRLVVDTARFSVADAVAVISSQ